MWLKSITMPHPAAGQPVGELLRALEVPAQPEEVQGFGPELDAVVGAAVSAAAIELGGDQVQVLVE